MSLRIGIQYEINNDCCRCWKRGEPSANSTRLPINPVPKIGGGGGGLGLRRRRESSHASMHITETLRDRDGARTAAFMAMPCVWLAAWQTQHLQEIEGRINLAKLNNYHLLRAWSTARKVRVSFLQDFDFAHPYEEESGAMLNGVKEVVFCRS